MRQRRLIFFSTEKKNNLNGPRSKQFHFAETKEEEDFCRHLTLPPPTFDTQKCNFYSKQAKKDFFNRKS